MPPAKKRSRTYDAARTRTAVLTQFSAVRAGLRTLDERQLALSSGLGEWSVRDLAAHICMTVESVSLALDRPAPPRAGLTVPEYPSVTAPFADAIAEGSHALAAAEPDLDALYARTEERLTERLAGVPGDRVVDMRAAAMTLTDFLVTRTVELVVHTDDLNRAVPELDIPLDRQALAACTRLLADALALKAPGASTEVRIPPFAVVQCVEGPRHTRGTPPNVVETDPLTWLRLATGRLDWPTALKEAQVSASGERADLSALLPLLS
ncbi:sterol carrier family protein [Streptomyces sp. NPDC059785]|uniref:maleylpyruvate isomerase family mycothiol-dependent enzyme n=1 Tax=unclassified Streptomyces TaxID=2593676 RepID=UPI00365CB247